MVTRQRYRLTFSGEQKDLWSRSSSGLSGSAILVTPYLQELQIPTSINFFLLQKELTNKATSLNLLVESVLLRPFQEEFGISEITLRLKFDFRVHPQYRILEQQCLWEDSSSCISGNWTLYSTPGGAESSSNFVYEALQKIEIEVKDSSSLSYLLPEFTSKYVPDHVPPFFPVRQKQANFLEKNGRKKKLREKKTKVISEWQEDESQ